MILLVRWDMSFFLWPLWTKAQWPRFSYQQAVKFFWNLDRAKENQESKSWRRVSGATSRLEAGEGRAQRPAVAGGRRYKDQILSESKTRANRFPPKKSDK